MYEYLFNRIINSEDEIELDAIYEVLARNADGMNPVQISQLRILAMMQKEIVIMRGMIELYKKESGKTTP